MTESSADVVIVGGGIAGMTAAYYLAKAGVASVVVERDAIGSHASGFAYGGLSPLSGFGIPGPQAEIALDGMRLHRELSKTLLEETGIDVDFRVRTSLALAFTEADVRRLRAALPWQQQQPGYAVRWLDIAEARRGEPRVSGETLGGTLTQGGGAGEPHRLVLALAPCAARLRGAGRARARDRPTARRRARDRRGPRARGVELRDRGARARPLERRGIGVDRRADRRSSAQGPDPPSAGSGSADRMLRRLGSQLRDDQDRRSLVGGDHRGRSWLRRRVDARGP